MRCCLPIISLAVAIMRCSTLSVCVGLDLLGLAGMASAFWRMECRSRSGLARTDPLVNSGAVSEFGHASQGGRVISSTIAQL